jgi:two-component system, LytTR family, response regulator LytT
MKVFIIEDEYLAVQRLQKLLLDIIPDIQIVGTADGIDTSVAWLKANAAPDLILMDIELTDGQSFEIFKLIDVQSPVIFITSYDEYAIQAFKVNSIDYLLKPVKKDDLERALQKFERLNAAQSTAIDITKLIAELQKSNQVKELRTRFLVRQGQRFLPVETSQIAYFYSEDKLTFCVTHDRNRHIIDYTLDQLEDMLDPKQYFRINRQFVADIKAIEHVQNYFNGKLKIDLNPAPEKEVIVSRERATQFKDWMGQ